MVPASSRLSQDSLLRFAQFAALLLASVVVVVFLRFHLVNSARSFREDFERQSFIEIGRGETFLIARKLAALGKAEQFSCISATKGGILFFEEKNGSCEEGFFSVRERVEDPNHQLEISFTIRIQESLWYGLVFFLLSQALLGGTIIFTQWRIHFLRTENDLALAALAQQVAHDIQSPLAILQSLNSPTAAPDLHRRALVRLRTLVGHLRGETERQGLESVAVILNSAVQEKLAEFGSPPPAEILLRWHSPVENSLLPGSAFEWRRVISNLLNNAAEACEAGKAKISVEIKSEAGKIIIMITDNGKGISKEAQGKIGRAGFSQGKASGKGLGLFLAKKFVKSVGGTIEISSEVGKGATVTIAVPFSEVTLAVLVDDDAELAKAWTMAAKKKGITLQHYETLEAFLAAKDSIPKDTPIYLDLEFPGSQLSPLIVGGALGREGFTNLTIATGRPPATASKPAWARAIIGKNPPWLS